MSRETLDVENQSALTLTKADTGADTFAFGAQQSDGEVIHSQAHSLPRPEDKTVNRFQFLAGSYGSAYGEIHVTGNSQPHIGDSFVINNASKEYLPSVHDFQSIFTSFVQQQDAQLRDDLIHTKTASSLHSALEDVQRQQAKTKQLRSLNRIHPLVDRLANYVECLGAFEGLSDEIIASLWSPVLYVIQLCQDRLEAYDCVLNAMACFGIALPSLASKAPPSSYIVLPMLYMDIMNFYSNLLHVLQTRGWHIFFDSIWLDNQAVRDLILSHVKKHAEEVVRPDLCFTPHEMDNALSKCSGAFQAQLTRQRGEGQAAFDTWTSQINPTSYDNEYRDLLGSLAPGTGKWFLRDPVCISWRRSQSISNSILWLCGIPGAGKSHLAAKAIQSLKKDGLNVLHIFLDYEKSDSVKWISVMHSLIYQLLIGAEEMQGTFINAWNQDIGDLLASTERNQDLLVKLMSCIGHVYIVIDGLDEVAAKKDILEGLMAQVSSYDGLRLLCCSREELEISNLIKAKSLMLRVQAKNHSDIGQYFEQYVTNWMSGRSDIPELEKEKIKTRLKLIPSKADGMFLYARLMLDHLKGQGSLAAITRECNNLPDKIEDIYDRILERAQEGDGTGKTILMWIATFKNSLRVEEICLAIGVKLHEKSLNPENKLIGDIRHYCGPIVEIKGDFVRLIHSSVKEYIFDRRSGPWLDPTDSQFQILSTMIHYLSIDVTDSPSCDQNMLERVESGGMALLTLSLHLWVDILKASMLKLSGSGDNRNMQLTQQLSTLLERRKFPAPDVSKEPEKPGKHVSEKTIKELTEKRRIHGLVKEVVEKPKHVPEFEKVLSKQSSLYKPLCQIAMANVSGLQAGEHWHPLNLHTTWANFRDILEGMICPGDHHNEHCHCDVLERFYGTNKFKCPRLDCPYSRLGFGSQLARQRHTDVHSAKFKCPLPECRWRSAFGSQKQLESHTSLFHLNLKAKISSAAAVFNDVDDNTLQEIMIDAIENSNAGILEACLQKSISLPLLNALMAYSYMSNADLSIVKLLYSHDTQVEHLETIQQLGPHFSLAQYLYVQQAVRSICDDVGLHLQPAISALTLAVAGSATTIVEWLISQGLSVAEQKTKLFASRPLDYLFALQLARTRAPQKRRPLELDLVRLLLAADAPVNPGQAISDLCFTSFIKAHDEAYCRAAEMLIEKGAIFREDAAWAIQRTSKSTRLVELAEHHGSQPAPKKTNSNVSGSAS